MCFKIKIIEISDDLKSNSKSLNISDLKSKSNHDFDFKIMFFYFKIMILILKSKSCPSLTERKSICAPYFPFHLWITLLTHLKPQSSLPGCDLSHVVSQPNDQLFIGRHNFCLEANQHLEGILSETRLRWK